MGNGRKARPNMGVRKTAAERIISIQETLSGRYNGYLCDSCNGGYLTLDIDQGTTPAMMKCYATEGCWGMAHSMGYPEGDPPQELGDPIFYWYKPSKAEFALLSAEMQENVRKGGLVRKATEAAPAWVKLAA